MTPSAAASATHATMGGNHHNDPVKQAEHNAAMALVSGKPTHVAKKNGSWFDPNTWEGGRVPGNNAKVHIKHGVSVSYDSTSNARLFTLNVEGNLKFATNKNTKMVVDTFVVGHKGKLQVGSKANPVKAGVKTEILIADNGKINTNWDPKQFSRGLISHGTVEMFGQAKTSHLKVSKNPMAGDRTLVLDKAPTNWQVGDSLILTGTRFRASANNGNKWDPNTEDEEVTIKSINGKTITLEETLKYNHDTPRGDLKAYVANQSRNIIIASENGDNIPVGQRGHTMFMHSPNVDVRYVEFQDLGRTDKSRNLNNNTNVNGRYSVHVHRAGTDGKPAILVGNVVDGSPGWGLTIHESSAIVESNVAYDVNGSAFVTESGNETGAFRKNISIKTDGIYGHNEKSGVDAHDFGKSGIGFWFAGRLFENEGNVAAGSKNAGMFYMHRGSKLVGPSIKDLPFPDLAKKRTADGKRVNVDQAPIMGFKDNEVIASGVGLHVVKDFPEQNHDLRTVLDGFKAWEVERGTQLQYTSHYTMNDFDLIGSKDSRFWLSDGVVFQKNTQDIVFNNATIDGFDAGIYAEPNTGEGPKQLNDRDLIWIDLKMKNNKQDFENFTLPNQDRLTKSDVRRGRLSFTEQGSDLLITGDDFKDTGYVQIKGTKTDSLGSVKLPFGDDKLILTYQDAEALAKKGYYTLPDGSKGAVIEEYFSDRVTGDTIKQAFVVKFKEDWWTSGSPNLGKLNPATLGGNKKVTLPRSKFRLNQDPIKPVTPITPTPPANPDPVEPTPPTPPVAPPAPTPPAPTPPAPVDPKPTPPDPIEPDPVQPDPVQPDPVQPDPIQPDPVVPAPVVPTPKPPTKPSDTLKPSLANLKPVASYDFETGRGAYVKDVSKNGRNNAGELWHGIAWGQGVDGNGVVMNGTGSVRIKNSRDINLGKHRKRSIALWFKADQDSNNGKKQVLYEEGGTTRGLNTYINDDGLLYVGGWNQGGTKSNRTSSWIESKQKVSDGKWHHVALVLDGTNKAKPNALTAYLDGKKIGSDRGSQLLQHSDRIALGNIAGRTRFHDGIGTGNQGLIGSLDEAHIFNQALTGQQVQALTQQF